MKRRIVVLGNSAAAVSAIRAIRSRNEQDALTLVSREACNAYSPALTTYYLRGVLPEERLSLCDQGFYRRHDVRCLLGREAVAVDAASQTVSLDDGRRLPFDALLVATGASPATLPDVDPDAAAGVCYLRTIVDARRIRRLAARARRVGVLGAGLVSLQTAAALVGADREVTCVAASDQVLSQNLDRESASIVADHVAEHGVCLLFGRGVTGIAACGEGYRVSLSTGEQLIFDMIVVGKGVVPSHDFLDAGQIRIDRGIIVDDRLRSSVENIYAAGDVAQGRNRVTGEQEVVANWVDACEQGRVAGLNMAGAHVCYPGSLPENVTTLFGLSVVSIGVVCPVGEDTAFTTDVVSHPSRRRYRKVVYSGGVPVGAILVGDLADAGVVRAAVARGEYWPPSTAARVLATRGSWWPAGPRLEGRGGLR